MELLERDGRVTRRSLVEAGELPARTSGRVLAGMVERGLLVPDGRQGRSKGYVRAG
jgi:predicted HTH transcriptional regulator